MVFKIFPETQAKCQILTQLWKSTCVYLLSCLHLWLFLGIYCPPCPHLCLCLGAWWYQTPLLQPVVCSVTPYQPHLDLHSEYVHPTQTTLRAGQDISWTTSHWTLTNCTWNNVDRSNYTISSFISTNHISSLLDILLNQISLLINFQSPDDIL